jgi:hypothetical protein
MSDFLPSGYCETWRKQNDLPPATWHGDYWQCPHREPCVYAHPGPNWVSVDEVIRPDGTRPSVTLTNDQVDAARAILDQAGDVWESPLLQRAREVCHATRLEAGISPAGDDHDCRECLARDSCDLG